MSNILEKRFFKYSSCKGFDKESFLKNLYWQKQRGLDCAKLEDGKTEECYFLETRYILSDLVRGYKYYHDAEYKKNIRKKTIKGNGSMRWSARDAKEVFKKFSFLEDLDLLKELNDLVCKEIAIQKVHHSRHVRKGNEKNIKFQGLDYFINYIDSIPEDRKDGISIDRFYTSFGVKMHGAVEFLIDEDMAIFLRKKGILTATNIKEFPSGPSYDGFYLNKKLNQYLPDFKKERIKEKMAISFDNKLEKAQYFVQSNL